MLSIEEYFKELLEKHPYKQRGNRDSYNTYNEGWQDALDLAMQLVKRIQLDTIDITIKELANSLYNSLANNVNNITKRISNKINNHEKS